MQQKEIFKKISDLHKAGFVKQQSKKLITCLNIGIEYGSNLKSDKK